MKKTFIMEVQEICDEFFDLIVSELTEFVDDYCEILESEE